MNKFNSVTIGIFLSIFGSILFENIAKASPVNPSIVKRDFENDDFKGQLPVENREEWARLANTGLEQDNRVGKELEELEEKRKGPVEGYDGGERIRGDMIQGREGASSKSAQVDELLPSRIQEGVGESSEDANHQHGSQTDPGQGQQMDIQANSKDVPPNQEQHSDSVPGESVQDLNHASLVGSDSTQKPQAEETVQGAKRNLGQFSSQQSLTNQDSDQQVPLHGPDQQLQQGSNQQLHLEKASDQQMPLQLGSNQQLPQLGSVQQGSNQQLPPQQGSNQQLPLQHGSNEQLAPQQGSDQQRDGTNQHLLQQGSVQQLPVQVGSNQHLPLQQSSDQHLPPVKGSKQQLPLQQGLDQHPLLQQGSNQQLPLQHSADQSAQTHNVLSQHLPPLQGSDKIAEHQQYHHGGDQQSQGEITRGNQREANPSQKLELDKTPNRNSISNPDQKSFLQLDLQNKLSPDLLHKDGTKETGNDVPEEFKVEDNEPLDGSNEPAAQSKDHYSNDGYLDPPANNLDTDRSLSDKGDEEVAHNANAYDEDGEADTRINNKNIIDDNNEQAVYNNDNAGDTKAEQTDDNDEKDQGFDNDYDDYSYEVKEDKDRLGHEETSTSSTPNKDDWYGVGKEEDGDDDDDVDGVLDKEDEDYSDPDIDQELEFQQTHQKRPHIDNKGEEFFYEDMKTNFKEGVVENKLLKNRVGLNAPSSMVLFYTWIILIVLIAVVSLSAFRYRCKGVFMNGPRNFRNGNHGNYRPGEENKRLLENVYT
ncbi:involucrin-like [Haliotis asinina]|uniref:involucrin-like n=1 Tax=Haliotis asinina TaxID=109174 RepID=UPI003531D2B9